MKLDPTSTLMILGMVWYGMVWYGMPGRFALYLAKRVDEWIETKP